MALPSVPDHVPPMVAAAEAFSTWFQHEELYSERSEMQVSARVLLIVFVPVRVQECLESLHRSLCEMAETEAIKWWYLRESCECPPANSYLPGYAGYGIAGTSGTHLPAVICGNEGTRNGVHD